MNHHITQAMYKMNPTTYYNLQIHLHIYYIILHVHTQDDSKKPYINQN